jgi:hypothetical protein
LQRLCLSKQPTEASGKVPAVLPDAYFDRFDTAKYRNKNPIQRALIRRFVATLHSMFIAAGPHQRILEVGVGEGFLSGWLSEHFPEKDFAGVDLSSSDITLLKQKFPRIEAHVSSIEEIGFLNGRFDLVMCCEVLEHVPDPVKAVAALRAIGAKRAILSVPHEPFFMLSNLLRGKNITRLGNDIDHHNHWGKRSFEKLCASEFNVLSVETSYPWVLALLEAR